jgi:hypothetical protein
MYVYICIHYKYIHMLSHTYNVQFCLCMYIYIHMYSWYISNVVSKIWMPKNPMVDRRLPHSLMAM